MVISPVAATDPALLQLVAEQQAELAGLAGYSKFGPRADVEYVAAYLDGHPVGCGGVQPLEPGVGEVKRMYVRPLFRGKGWSYLILAAIEEYAVEHGLHTLRLETGGHLAAAMALYNGAGYERIEAFGEYAGNPTSVCFEKVLVGSRTSGRS